MSLTRKRKSSPKQVEANRQNGRKSNGPCTPQGKLHVALNAVKHGLHAEPVIQGMLAIGEKPRTYYRLLAQLVPSLHPANPHQRMQLEDICHLRCEKLRLRRARLALIAGKMHGLERERDRRLLEFDYDAPDLPQTELLQKGLDRVPDSAPKFEKMLACVDVLIDVAKHGRFTLDPEPELNLLYGQQPSLDGAYLRNVFRRFVAAQRQQEEKRSAEAPVPSAKSEAGVRGSGFLVRNSGLRDSGLEDSPPTEPERLLLLKTLFAAKQRALRRYQLFNREFVEITPDQRDACYAPSKDADVNLMRQEAQNERQLRLALKLYWQTQKEDAARLGGEAGEADELLEALEKSLAGGSEGEKGQEGNLFDENGTRQVIEKTGEVSGNGQNNPKFGIDDGRLIPPRGTDLAWGASDVSPSDNPSEIECRLQQENFKKEIGIDNLQSAMEATPHPGHLVEAARPKVKELLEQMQSDPEARALVETFLLSQMVQEDSQQEEQELAALQRERQKREALEEGLEQMVVAQQELESQNRRRRARGGESEIVHQQVREQIKPAEAVVAQRREPTHEEIVRKIGEAIGLRGPEEYRVESEVEGMPGFHLTEQEYWDYQQGRGPAWEEEQRRKTEQEKKRLESERLEE
jgi:hypothetical protein